MKKITPAMQDLLDAMAAGKARVHYMSFSRHCDAYYLRSDTMRPCTRQVLGLVDRGLVEHVLDDDRRTIKGVRIAGENSPAETAKSVG